MVPEEDELDEELEDELEEEELDEVSPLEELEEVTHTGSIVEVHISSCELLIWQQSACPFTHQFSSPLGHRGVEPFAQSIQQLFPELELDDEELEEELLTQAGFI